MRTPSLQIVNGEITPLSQDKENFHIYGPGIPEIQVESGDCYYRGDCIYGSTLEKYHLNKDYWTLDIKGQLFGTTYIASTPDFEVTPGGWALVLHPQHMAVYYTVLVNKVITVDKRQMVEFKSVNYLRGYVRITLVKTENEIALYVDGKNYGKIWLRYRTQALGICLLGTRRGDHPTYRYASRLYCNELNFYYGYPFNQSEIVELATKPHIDEAWSFFQLKEIAPDDFEGPRLKSVATFPSPLGEYHESSVIEYFNGTMFENMMYATYIKTGVEHPYDYTILEGGYVNKSLSGANRWIEVGSNHRVPISLNRLKFHRATSNNPGQYDVRDFQLYGKTTPEEDWVLLYEGSDLVFSGLSCTITDMGEHAYPFYRIVVTRTREVTNFADGPWHPYKISFQLAPRNLNNKVFSLTNGEKETVATTRNNLVGGWIKNINRIRNLKVVNVEYSNGTIKQIDIASAVKLPPKLPWGDKLGLIARDSKGDLTCKTIKGNNLELRNGLKGKVLSSKTPHGIARGVDQDGRTTIYTSTGSGAPFTTNVFRPSVPDQNIVPSSGYVPDASTRVLQPGVYMVTAHYQQDNPGKGCIQITDYPFTTVLAQSVTNCAFGNYTSTIDDIVVIKTPIVPTIRWLGDTVAPSAYSTYQHPRLSKQPGSYFTATFRKIKDV